MAIHPLPRVPEDVTPAWLTEVLRRSGAISASTVVSVDRRRVGEGAGMLGVIDIATIGYDAAEAGAPTRVVIKLPTPVAMNRAVAVSFNVYRREVLFYATLADMTVARTPTIYLSEIENESDFVIIMEDLSPYRLGDQLAGCSLEDATAAVPEAAKLHASFWNDVDRAELDFVPWHFPGMHSDGMFAGTKAGWDPMVATFGDTVPAFMNDARERYIAAVPALQEWMAARPVTCVHGDYRMDNLFFGDNPHQDAVVLMDWQGVLRSKGVQDIAYLLSHNMPVDLRRAHEHDLLRLYAETLAAHGVTDYSTEAAFEDYRKAVLYMWVYVVVIAGTLDATNERGFRWMSEMISRSAAAIADLDGLSLIP